MRHTITHRAIEVEVWRGTTRGPVATGACLRWADPADPGVALTALARRLAGTAKG